MLNRQLLLQYQLVVACSGLHLHQQVGAYLEHRVTLVVDYLAQTALLHKLEVVYSEARLLHPREEVYLALAPLLLPHQPEVVYLEAQLQHQLEVVYLEAQLLHQQEEVYLVAQVQQLLLVDFQGARLADLKVKDAVGDNL